MVFGTFDILHPGHIFYITKAMKIARKIIIVVARDSRVLERKKRRPIHSENQRRERLTKIFPKAKVILGDENDIFAPIYEFEPDVLVFGYDQYIPPNLEEKFPNICTRKIGPHHERVFKSSIIRSMKKSLPHSKI